MSGARMSLVLVCWFLALCSCDVETIMRPPKPGVTANFERRGLHLRVTENEKERRLEIELRNESDVAMVLYDGKASWHRYIESGRYVLEYSPASPMLRQLGAYMHPRLEKEPLFAPGGTRSHQLSLDGLTFLAPETAARSEHALSPEAPPARGPWNIDRIVVRICAPEEKRVLLTRGGVYVHVRPSERCSAESTIGGEIQLANPIEVKVVP